MGYFYAWWTMWDEKKGRLVNCIRGPKDSRESMIDEVARIYNGTVNYEELDTRDLNKAKGMLRDKIAMSSHDALKAMERFRIKSIPHQTQYEPT